MLLYLGRIERPRTADATAVSGQLDENLGDGHTTECLVYTPQRMNDLYRKYKRCVVSIEVTRDNGDKSIGSGFHIGDGYIVTARHVVTAGSYNVFGPETDDPLEIYEQLTSADDDIDVALVRSNLVVPAHPLTSTRMTSTSIPLGSPSAKDVSDEIVMSSVLLLGYPPVPATHPTLVAAHGYVSAVVQKYLAHDLPYFVITSTPRGGFSGGPVISEHEYLVGVCTEAFSENNEPEELGFAAALPTQLLLDVLDENHVTPSGNAITQYCLHLRSQREQDTEGWGHDPMRYPDQ